MLQARFDNEGMALTLDTNLLSKVKMTSQMLARSQQAGWVFVTPDEVPEMATNILREG